MDQCFSREYTTRKWCQVLVMTQDKGAPERKETNEICPNVYQLCLKIHFRPAVPLRSATPILPRHNFKD